jgi:membrane-associated progesterone receptor component
MHVWKLLIAAVASVGTIHAAIKMNQEKFDRFVMGIIRDVGRHKARQRRHQNSKGLMLTLLHQDNPLEDLLLNVEDEDESNLPSYTKAELLEFGDGLEGRPILISVFGRVYDVSAGSKFYGADGPYGIFAGHDVTYSLSTGCRTKDCVEMSAEGLDDKLLDEGKRWLSFFHLHDKYHLVGKLESDYVEILMSDLVDEGIAGEEGKPLKPPIFGA